VPTGVATGDRNAAWIAETKEGNGLGATTQSPGAVPAAGVASLAMAGGAVPATLQAVNTIMARETKRCIDSPIGGAAQPRQRNHGSVDAVWSKNIARCAQHGLKLKLAAIGRQTLTKAARLAIFGALRAGQIDLARHPSIDPEPIDVPRNLTVF
jgi:hypothetical protein